MSLVERLKAEKQAIGRRLDNELRDRQMRRRQFADAIGQDPSVVSRWIHGRQIPSKAWIAGWVKVLPGTKYETFDPHGLAPIVEREVITSVDSRPPGSHNTVLPEQLVAEGTAMLLRDPEALAIASTFVTLRPDQRQAVKELVHRLASEPTPGGERRRGGSARPRRQHQ